MLQTAAGLGGQLFGHCVHKHERHRPEQTLLYQIAEKHYPDFLTQLATEGKSLPSHVHQEFTDFLKCGLLEHGFLRVRCASCCHEKLVAFSCKRRGFCPRCGARRRVDSAALLVDEVLPKQQSPTVEQLTELLHIISQRVARFLEKRGLLERDEGNSPLTLDGLDEDPMQDIHSH